MHFKVWYSDSNDTVRRVCFLCFFPFRNKTGLKGTVSGTYSENLLEPSVIETLHKNRKAREPFAYAVNEAFIDFITNPRGMNPQTEQ